MGLRSVLQRPIMPHMIALIRFPIRAVVFLVGYISYWMEVAADWLVGASGKTEYVRVGSCNRCGRCCRCLALMMPKGVSKGDRLVRFCIWWHRFAMNFRYVAEEKEGSPSAEGGMRSWIVYRCGYYKESGTERGCSIYPFRHRICRFFPRQKLYGRPPVQEDCGFSFVRREVLKRREEQRSNGVASFDDMISSARPSGRSD